MTEDYPKNNKGQYPDPKGPLRGEEIGLPETIHCKISVVVSVYGTN